MMWHGEYSCGVSADKPRIDAGTTDSLRMARIDSVAELEPFRDAWHMLE